MVHYKCICATVPLTQVPIVQFGPLKHSESASDVDSVHGVCVLQLYSSSY